MSRLLIFNFDGTGNEPSDVAQDVDYKGTKEDENKAPYLSKRMVFNCAKATSTKVV